MTCKYEELRDSNIQRNHDFLKSLGIEKPTAVQYRQPALISSRKRSYPSGESTQPKRRSVRLVESLIPKEEAPEVEKSARSGPKDGEDQTRKRITAEVLLTPSLVITKDNEPHYKVDT